MSELMKYKKLNEAFQYVSDEFLDVVELEKRKLRKQVVWIRYSIAVACICLLVMIPVSAMKSNWFGIRDLGISDSNNDYNMISLSGYQGSPEAEALREWNNFLENYDTDHKILDALGNGVFVAEGREDWFMYGVYSYEMGEKLDEIAEKYELELHSEINIINKDELMYRVGGNFMDTDWGGAYIYEDGTFMFDGNAELNEYGTIRFQLVRKVKGTFDELFLNIGQFEDYEEWQYVTGCDEMVLLALGRQNTSLIFVEEEDCFIAVNVLAGMEDGLTKDDLQELADQIDFSILMDVKIPDMRGDTIEIKHYEYL